MQKLKTIIIIFLIFTINNSINASERNDTTFSYSNLELSICYNHSFICFNQLLYYRGVSELLNEYVKNKVKKDLLDNRIVSINIGCVDFGGHPSIEMYRSKHEYFVFIHDLPKLEYLVKIIDYFSHSDWKSFSYDLTKIDNDIALKNFNKRMNNIIDKEDLSFFNDKSVIVFRLDDIEIKLKNETLSTYIFNVLQDKNFTQIPPIKFKDRYFLWSNNFIYVFEGIDKYKSYKISGKNHCDNDTEIKKYSDWLNVNNSGFSYSYCYSKEAFYVID